MESVREITKETFIGEDAVANKTNAQNMLCNQVQEESQVIVHCTFTARSFSRIRVWQSTYLYAMGIGHKSHLLHAYGISVYPADWMNVPAKSSVRFTLVFSGLPRDCNTFDLLEKAHDPGPFSVVSVIRNNTDVYYVNLYSEKLTGTSY